MLWKSRQRKVPQKGSEILRPQIVTEGTRPLTAFGVPDAHDRLQNRTLQTIDSHARITALELHKPPAKVRVTAAMMPFYG